MFNQTSPLSRRSVSTSSLDYAPLSRSFVKHARQRSHSKSFPPALECGELPTSALIKVNSNILESTASPDWSSGKPERIEIGSWFSYHFPTRICHTPSRFAPHRRFQRSDDESVVGPESCILLRKRSDFQRKRPTFVSLFSRARRESNPEPSDP